MNKKQNNFLTDCSLLLLYLRHFSLHDSFISTLFQACESLESVTGAYFKEEIEDAIKKRLNTLRHIRCCVIAEEYAAEYPTFQPQENNMLKNFAEARGIKLKDQAKVLQTVRIYRDQKDAVLNIGKSSTRRSRKEFNDRLEIKHYRKPEFQMCLKSKCYSQDWPGVCDVTLPTFGRAVIATQKFSAGDVLLDYHGRIVEHYRSVEEYCQEDPDVRSPNYIVEIRQSKRRLIDATQDPCFCHISMRCLGRLVNHASEKTKAGRSRLTCNLRLKEIVCDKIAPDATSRQHLRYVVLVAKRDIEPLEQLLFDYGDEVARNFDKD